MSSRSSRTHLAPRLAAGSTPRTSHLLLLGLLALLLYAGLGCTQSTRPKSFRGQPIPARGEKLPEAVWKAVDETEAKEEEKGVRRENRAFLLPLPMQVHVRNFELDPKKGEARSSRLVWNDLGTPFLLTFLPVRVRWEEYEYRRGQEFPTGKRLVEWNLLTASDEHLGTANPATRVEGSGVPLIYGKVKVQDARTSESMMAWNTLWTLGPAAMKFRAQDESEGGAHGYVAAPLLAGGILGALLWTDYELRAGTEKKVSGHGPLIGFLGYLRAQGPVEGEWWQGDPAKELAKDGSEIPTVEPRRLKSVRFLLGGLLWHDFSETRDGKTINAGHGPLWSAFGWGVRKERPALRFLGIPIGL